MSIQVRPISTPSIDRQWVSFDLCSGGQGRSGVDLAPNRLISAGLVSQLSKLGWEVHYETQQSFLDTPFSTSTPTTSNDPNRLPDGDIGRMKKPRLVSAVCEKVAGQVGGIAEKGWLPLTLGGDHSLVSRPLCTQLSRILN